MPFISIQLSNHQINLLQASASITAQIYVLGGDTANARYFGSLAKQLKEIERDPEKTFAGPTGEVVWPDNPVVTQVE